MKTADIWLAKVWQETADIIGGEFTISKQIINGGCSCGALYLLAINVVYRGFDICISEAVGEYPFLRDEYKKCKIRIAAKKVTERDVSLSVWRKDYMDWIFGFANQRTGYRDFDKRIGIRASKEIRKKLSAIFKNRSQREEMINDKCRTYNVDTSDGVATIQFRLLKEVNSSEMIIEEYNRVVTFVDGFADAGVFE